MEISIIIGGVLFVGLIVVLVLGLVKSSIATTDVYIVLGLIAAIVVGGVAVFIFRSRVSADEYQGFLANMFNNRIIGVILTAAILLPDFVVGATAIADIIGGSLNYSVISIAGVAASFLVRLLVASPMGSWIPEAVSTASSIPSTAASAVASTASSGWSLFKKVAPAVHTLEGKVGLLGGMRGGGSTLDLCSHWGDAKVPLSTIALLSIFTVYVTDAAVKQSPIVKHIGIYGGIAVAVHIMSILKAGCGYSAQGWATGIMSGLGFGGAIYLLLKEVYPDFLPIPQSSGPQPTCNADTSLGGTEDDTMVCDMYINGKRVTSAEVPT